MIGDGVDLEWPGATLPEKMNPKVKKAWVKALRSGDYAQGMDFLMTISGNGLGGEQYCCLGVIADVQGEKFFAPENVPDERDRVLWARGIRGTPMEARSGETTADDRQFGLGLNFPTKEFCASIGLSPRAAQVLAELNDDGHDFVTIAQVIEDYL